MGKAFDWDELEKGNQKVLAGKKFFTFFGEGENPRPHCQPFSFGYFVK